MKELYKIAVDESDDLNFISIVNRLITGISRTKKFETVTITKVKNWFDHKWLNYSGSEAVPFESGGLVNNDMALSDKWKDQITFPPFNPNRIISSRTYLLNREVLKSDLRPIHRYQVSGQNLQNRVDLQPENFLYAWFSSNSQINKKGSLMIYELFNKSVTNWYCQMELNKVWKIGKSKNISRERLIEMTK